MGLDPIYSSFPRFGLDLAWIVVVYVCVCGFFGMLTVYDYDDIVDWFSIAVGSSTSVAVISCIITAVIMFIAQRFLDLICDVDV